MDDPGGHVSRLSSFNFLMTRVQLMQLMAIPTFASSVRNKSKHSSEIFVRRDLQANAALRVR
jgi:hypothetical protein